MKNPSLELHLPQHISPKKYPISNVKKKLKTIKEITNDSVTEAVFRGDYKFLKNIHTVIGELTISYSSDCTYLVGWLKEAINKLKMMHKLDNNIHTFYQKYLIKANQN